VTYHLAVRRRVLCLVALAAASLVAALAPGAPGAGRPVTIAWVGDIAMSGSGGENFLPSAIRRKLRGNLVIGNLEGTLASGGYSKCGTGSTNCFAFRASPSFGRVLKHAGFTLMNLANNHAYDYGAEGASETLASLRSVHLLHTGRPGEITIVRVGHTRIAVLGFAPYTWAQSLTDIGAAKRLVRRAATRADTVIVLMHAGGEGSDHQHVAPGTEWFLGENRGNPVAFTHAVVTAGADLVLGSGPHVLRGMEWYHGRLIAYSLGNFLGNGTLSTGGILGISGILHVTLRPSGAWVGGNLTPVVLVPPGVPEPDPAEAAHGVVRDLSREDFGRNAIRVSRSGKLLPPVWRSG
jgi:Bacterial capsule synthesis protein PGA_cap